MCVCEREREQEREKERGISYVFAHKPESPPGSVAYLDIITLLYRHSSAYVPTGVPVSYIETHISMHTYTHTQAYTHTHANKCAREMPRHSSVSSRHPPTPTPPLQCMI